jgi:DNA gyrase subunit B
MYPPVPLKLNDCTQHGAGSGAELFLVEGDSAAGSVSRVRDEQFQAVLPMQGKPLNAIKATAKKVEQYALFVALVDALGTGLSTEAGGQCMLEQRRYDRVVLLMDPDADGIHCGVLMLMFFYRFMRPLLDGGHILIAQAPMASVSAEVLDQPLHAHTDMEYRLLCKQLHEKGIAEFHTVRYRGLAGIDLPTLAHTCVHPDTRRLRSVSSADAQAAIAVFGGA